MKQRKREKEFTKVKDEPTKSVFLAERKKERKKEREGRYNWIGEILVCL